MNLTTIFLSLCLMVLQVSAFWPYIPKYKCIEDGQCPGKRWDEVRDQEVDQGGEKTFALKIRQRRPQNNLPHSVQIASYAERLIKKFSAPNSAKRANNYNILKSSTPTSPNSAAMDQDGTDFSYFATVNIGSTGAPFHMLMDTGASSSWVMGSSCTSAACLIHNTFDATKSTSYSSAGKDFSVGYGSGSVSGSVMTESISLAGFTFPLMFGLANVTSKDFLNFPLDGILGLSQSPANSDPPSFVATLAKAKVLSANLFGINLNRASDGTNDGEINFGAPDTSKYTGSLSYTSIVTAGGQWNIAMDDAGFNGKAAGVKGHNAVIDTGTSYCFIPPADAKVLYSVVPNSQISTDGNSYSVPCNTSAPLQFTFSGVSYDVSAKDWVGGKISDTMCTSNVFSRAVTQNGEWLLGDVFLKNVYAVFDVDKNRIGFGVKPAATSTSPAAASSTKSSGKMTSSISLVTTSTSLSSTPTSTANSKVDQSGAISTSSSNTASTVQSSVSGTSSTASAFITSTTGTSGSSQGFNAAVSSSATPPTPVSDPQSSTAAPASASSPTKQGSASKQSAIFVAILACLSVTFSMIS